MMMHDEGTNLYEVFGKIYRDSMLEINIFIVVTAITIAVAIAFLNRKNAVTKGISRHGSVPAAE